MLYIGYGQIKKIKELVNKGEKILIFTGSTVYNRYESILKKYLPHCEISIFDNFTKNPKYNEIYEAIEIYKNERFDKIIAFGGGSVIDFAKAFKYYSKRKEILLAIPTTSGTGSEVTQFAVVYKNNEKISIDSSEILPDIAIVDSQLSQNAPRYIKACCMMDAYCQAIESFWAKKATKDSKRISLQAINLCRENIIKAVNTFDVIANENIAKAANLAGQAINITRTTAAHALSYKITSKYGIPHGHAVALCMPGVFVQNIETIPDADKLLDAIGIKKENIIKYFRELMKDIGLEYELKKLNIFDIKEIVESVNIERLSNNPKNMSKDELFSIFRL